MSQASLSSATIHMPSQRGDMRAVPRSNGTILAFAR
jgi:hypothetical protein